MIKNWYENYFRLRCYVRGQYLEGFFLSGGDWRNHGGQFVRILFSIKVLC